MKASSARRLRHATVILAVAAAAAWSVTAVVDNRQRAWAMEAEELQSFGPAHLVMPASGEFFPGLR